jgi:hypothetical protein
MLGRWYRALRATLEEGQDLILEYHTLSGEMIVVNQVAHLRDTDMLIFQGHGERGGELCQVLVSAPGFHTMLRVVALPDEEAERRPPIGFVFENPQAEQDEQR